MKINFKFQLLISLAVFLFLSCKKDKGYTVKDLPTKTIEASADLKSLAYFKPGSYWIVLDTLSNKSDSIYVTSNQINTKSINKNDTIYNYLELNTVCTSKNYTFALQIKNDPEDANSSSVFYLSFVNFGSGPIINLNNVGVSVANSSLITSYKTDSVLVNGNWYYDLNSSTYKHGGKSNMLFSSGYSHWKKGIGMVVFYSVYDAKQVCLKLVRSHIIQ